MKINFKIRNGFMAIIFGVSCFAAPVNLQANLFSHNSYLRKSLRIAGGAGLITLFAERMISYSKREHEPEVFKILFSLYSCYLGFKIISKEI